MMMAFSVHHQSTYWLLDTVSLKHFMSWRSTQLRVLTSSDIFRVAYQLGKDLLCKQKSLLPSTLLACDFLAEEGMKNQEKKSHILGLIGFSYFLFSTKSHSRWSPSCLLSCLYLGKSIIRVAVELPVSFRNKICLWWERGECRTYSDLLYLHRIRIPFESDMSRLKRKRTSGACSKFVRRRQPRAPQRRLRLRQRSSPQQPPNANHLVKPNECWV